MGAARDNKKLPEFFRPLFWSYNFDSLDLGDNRKTIVLTAINYGSLRHWRWVRDYYGKTAVAGIISSVPASELKRRAGKLAEILFKIKLNYAPRRAH
ncbi:MAG: hypothetical protein AAB731_00300 [Patescibacteria group bacterium]